MAYTPVFGNNLPAQGYGMLSGGHESHRSDGEAVDVVIPAGLTVTKGLLYYIQGWHGVAMNNGVAGDIISLEIDEDEYELPVGTIAAAKGDILYLNTASQTFTIATTDRPVLKVTVAKDANNLVWAKTLPNLTA
jgi:hypothetical protein